MLKILYQDDHYVAVYKPAGLLVHRTGLARESDAALQRLRDQLGRVVYPVHRLDRATAGVLVFALSREAMSSLMARFEAGEVEKSYLAVVRGYTPESGCIERPLKLEKGVERTQPARTDYRRLATVELPIPVARYPAARYSLVEVFPRTGRYHQIRRHCNGESHPVVGDTTHGDSDHNRLFRQHFNCHRLLLLARSLVFEHPVTGEIVTIRAEPDAEWQALMARLGWSGDCPGMAGQEQKR